MLTRGRTPRPRAVATLATGAVAALAIAACGSSAGSSGPAASRNPQTLLRQTFSSSHTVKSGVLGFSLVVTPRGSSVITTPLSLSLGGPFQSRGKGRTPESALTIAFSGLGKKASFGVRTTADAAYVALQGTNYRLPASDFAKLGSTLSGNQSESSAPGLSTFGIDPESWLRNPRIVGTQTVDGATTEHLHATVDVPAFVQSLDKVLAKESSTLRKTTGRATTISPATASKIAAAVRNPTVDLYTGRSDATLRRLVVSATVPVSGAISTRLGGLTSATFNLSFDYSQLNRPQTISAPGDVHSYAQLQTRLQSIGAALQSELGGGLSSGTTGSGTTGSGAGTTGASGKVSRYSSCISKAGGDVRKMRHCATLLQSGG